MDDEIYVLLNPSETPGKKYYHCRDPKVVKYEDRVKPKTKFPEKILVWQAIDYFGNISQPYISKGCINQTIYKTECLTRRLLPFIHKHHEIGDVLFWPGLATSHYAKTFTEFMRQKNLNFVSKEENAPNVPQCRPIERFWALCKANYSKLQKQPRNVAAFRRVWKRISKEVAKTSGAQLMAPLRKKLRIVGRKGVRTILSNKNKTRIMQTTITINFYFIG